MRAKHAPVGAGFKPARTDAPPSRRLSLRLPDYDYATPGAYFITICVKDRECRFGEISDGQMHLNRSGRIAENTWQQLNRHYPAITLGEFVIMPNHFHGLIWLGDSKHGLSEIIRGFKTYSARQINQAFGTPGHPLWQRGFYDHVIRNDGSLAKIREYILGNPAQWHLDRENPETARAGFKPAPTCFEGGDSGGLA